MKRASLIETQESTTKIKVEEDEILAREGETQTFLLLLLVVHLLGFLPINIYKSVSCLLLPDHPPCCRLSVSSVLPLAPSFPLLLLLWLSFLPPLSAPLIYLRWMGNR